MARIRNIKPSFFLNDDLAALSPLTRLAYAGLWCLADREGRLEDRPLRIKPQVLPYDVADMDQLLDELARAKFIVRYEVAGERYIEVANFLKHQSPHAKEAASTIPAPGSTGGGGKGPSGGGPGQHQESTVLAPDLHQKSRPDHDPDPGKIREGKGGDRACVREEVPPPPPPVELTLEETGSDAGPGEPAAEAQPEQGPEEVAAAAPVVEANGWAFGADELAKLADAVGDMPFEPQELPGLLGQRLRKRASPMNEGGPSWPASVPDRWDAKPGADVAAWSAAAMAIARRKAGDDRGRLINLAAGAVGQALLAGDDLPAEERRRGITTLPGGRTAAPAAATEEAAGWRAWLGQQGGIGHEAFVVGVAKSFAKSHRVDPARYLALFIATLEAARAEAGGPPIAPTVEELCQQRARDFVLQELWDDLAELKSAASG